jgi:Tol biopolymer transport system component
LRWRGLKPFRLTAGPLSVDHPQFSPSGRRIFYVGDLLQCELVQFDPATRNWEPFLRGINAFQLEFSRDGKWITYVAPPGHSVWCAREDGSEAIQLTAPPLNVINPRLSPDNSEVVFWGSVPGQTPGMFMVSAKGGPVQPLTQDRKASAGEREPSWSTDGHSVLYEVRGALWILDVGSRKAVRLPGSNGLQFPRWSPDGKYGVAADSQSRLWRYDMAAQKRVLLTAAGSGYPTWSADSHFVYFQNDASSNWYRVRISDRNITEVASLAGLHLTPQALGWVGLTPAGKTISARETSTRQIYAMDWDAPE